MISAPPQQEAVSSDLGSVLHALVTNPKDLLWRGWNWKAAVLSSAIRAHVFLFANLSAGWGPASKAGLAELAFRFVTSGFCGALTQSFRNVNPPWAGAAAAAFLLPAVSHTLEFLFHWLRGTPNLRASILASVCFTAVSTTFNWFAMRQGLLIVGRGEKPLWRDLQQMPSLFREISRSLFRGAI